MRFFIHEGPRRNTKIKEKISVLRVLRGFLKSSVYGRLGYNKVVVDPRDPQMVFAAGSAGVFRSNDAGQTWTASSQGLGTTAIVALALNPAQPDRLYAASADGSLFRSEDNARSWQAIASAAGG